ncbi:MAG: flagellar hook-associated protein 3 [Planctomycetota bacterium]|nr:MAG: flagellar hook-associated protein 3 [Planctomycetota bacterium]
MTFRVGSGTAYRQVQIDVARAARSLAHVQRQLSTGRRVTRPADDPYATARLVGVRAALERLDAFAATGAELDARLGVSEDKLRYVSDRLIRARELAVAGANATYAPEDRIADAREVDGILEELVAAANAQLDGRYLFGGADDAAPPVEVERDAEGRIVAVRYVAEQPADRRQVGAQLTVAGGLLASEVFGQTERQLPVYTGNTGARPSFAASADTGVGRQTLVVAHTRTRVGDEAGPGGGDSVSGIAPGASAADDTILGPLGAHVLAVRDVSPLGDGSRVELALDGGEAVTVDTAGADDVVLEGPSGERVSLDVRHVTPGFSGTVALGGDGTLSLDGGASTVPIAFSESQTVEHSGDGSRLHVDTRAVRVAGSETVEHPGSLDVFGTLIELRDALEGRTSGEVSEQLEQIGARLGDLERVHAGVTAAVAELGVRRSAIASVGEQIAAERLRLETLRSESEDVDLVDTIAAFQQRQTALERALQVGARALRLSIMDFMR